MEVTASRSLWLLNYVTPKRLIWFGDAIYFRYLNQSVSAESRSAT